MVGRYEQFGQGADQRKQERRFRIKSYLEAYHEFASGLPQALQGAASGASMGMDINQAKQEALQAKQAEVGGAGLAAAGDAVGGMAGQAMSAIGQGMNKAGKRRRRRKK